VHLRLKSSLKPRLRKQRTRCTSCSLRTARGSRTGRRCCFPLRQGRRPERRNHAHREWLRRGEEGAAQDTVPHPTPCIRTALHARLQQALGHEALAGVRRAAHPPGHHHRAAEPRHGPAAAPDLADQGSLGSVPGGRHPWPCCLAASCLLPPACCLLPAPTTLDTVVPYLTSILTRAPHRETPA